MNGLLRSKHGRDIRLTKGICSGFGHDDPHDGFAIAGGRSPAGFRVGITTTTDEGRIADAAREFAADASRGGGGEETALFVDGDGTDGALIVATMMFGGVRVFAAAQPGFALGGRDEVSRIAERQMLL